MVYPRIKDLPDNATVVVFHGGVGPAVERNQRDHPWILDHWR